MGRRALRRRHPRDRDGGDAPALGIRRQLRPHGASSPAPVGRASSTALPRRPSSPSPRASRRSAACSGSWTPRARRSGCSRPADRGGVEVATVIGAGLFEWGDQDGSIGEARLQHPTGIASITQGFIVSDTYNHRLRSVHMEAGTVTTIAGGDPGFRDGIGSEARFFEPGGAGPDRRRPDRGRHREPRAPHGSTSRPASSRACSRCGLEPPATPARRLEPATLAANARGHAARDARGASGDTPRQQRRAARARPAELRPAGGDRAAGAADHDGAARRRSRCARSRDRARCASRLAAPSATIQDGEGAACRLAESAYVLPFTLEPGGLSRLTLE